MAGPLPKKRPKPQMKRGDAGSAGPGARASHGAAVASPPSASPPIAGAPVVPDVTETEAVFGAAMRLMPAYRDIPDEFKRQSNPFAACVSSLFFSGGSLAQHGITPKPGVPLGKVMGVLRACLCDFAPKHEHKEAGTAFLLAQWCDYSPKAEGRS